MLLRAFPLRWHRMVGGDWVGYFSYSGDRRLWWNPSRLGSDEVVSPEVRRTWCSGTFQNGSGSSSSLPEAEILLQYSLWGTHRTPVDKTQGSVFPLWQGLHLLGVFNAQICLLGAPSSSSVIGQVSQVQQCFPWQQWDVVINCIHLSVLLSLEAAVCPVTSFLWWI